MSGLPPEVRRLGWRLAMATGLDVADAVSFAAEAWWRHPDAPGLMWVTTRSLCVNEARHRSGRGTSRHLPPLLVLDTLPDRGYLEPGYARVEDADEVDRLLARLPRRTQLMLRAWLAEGCTQSEVGDALGIDNSRVSQVCSAARRQLKEVR